MWVLRLGLREMTITAKSKQLNNYDTHMKIKLIGCAQHSYVNGNLKWLMVQFNTVFTGHTCTCSNRFTHTIIPYIKSILPKGPYLPCVSMAGRALLAGYPQHVNMYSSNLINILAGISMSLCKAGISPVVVTHCTKPSIRSVILMDQYKRDIIPLFTPVPLGDVAILKGQSGSICFR